uniref:ANK_REP_REGION domain-containing protein n=1 Tax=Rhabditophanes sp. KR3021 TaxID=114890 RepID=A0AC35TYA3_9BILA
MDSIQLSFLEAVATGDTCKIKELLGSGLVNPNFHHKINGWTALHWAARRNFVSIGYDLINYGFSVTSKTLEGKIPFEVLPKNCSEELKALLVVEGSDIMVSANEQGDNLEFVPNYIKNPPFPHLNRGNNDSGIDLKMEQFKSSKSPESPLSPNGEKVFSYGRRDSLNKTRFLLVRTSSFNGKEAFRRITLPGGGSIHLLKQVIEKSMKCGPIRQILTLPHNILIEEDNQLREFSDCQKIDVIFEPNDETNNDRRPSLSESTSSQEGSSSIGSLKEVEGNNIKYTSNPIRRAKDIYVKNQAMEEDKIEAIISGQNENDGEEEVSSDVSNESFPEIRDRLNTENFVVPHKDSVAEAARKDAELNKKVEARKASYRVVPTKKTSQVEDEEEEVNEVFVEATVPLVVEHEEEKKYEKLKRYVLYAAGVAAVGVVGLVVVRMFKSH